MAVPFSDTDEEARHRSLTWPSARGELIRRLAEPAPARVRLIAGPRLVGKSTLLREVARAFGERVVWCSGAPACSLSSSARVAGRYEQPARLDRSASERGEQPAGMSWELAWRRAEEFATAGAPALLVIDDVHRWKGWESKLAGKWGRLRGLGLPLHAVTAAPLASVPSRMDGAQAWLDVLRLQPWDAAGLVEAGLASGESAADLVGQGRAHPLALRTGGADWPSTVRDLVVAVTLQQDIPTASTARRPDLLRRLFEVCASQATRLVSLHDLGAAMGGGASSEMLESYLQRLERAGLVARLPEVMSSRGLGDARAARFRILLPDNALFVSVPPAAPSFDLCVRNACLAHAWRHAESLGCLGVPNVDAIGVLSSVPRLLAVHLGPAQHVADALVAACERMPAYEPLLVGDEEARAAADEAEIDWVDWRAWLSWAGGVRIA